MAGRAVNMAICEVYAASLARRAPIDCGRTNWYDSTSLCLADYRSKTRIETPVGIPPVVWSNRENDWTSTLASI